MTTIAFASNPDGVEEAGELLWLLAFILADIQADLTDAEEDVKRERNCIRECFFSNKWLVDAVGAGLGLLLCPCELTKLIHMLPVGARRPTLGWAVGLTFDEITGRAKAEEAEVE